MPGLWYLVFWTVLAVCAASLLVAMLQPLGLLCMRGADPVRRRKARYYALCSAFIFIWQAMRSAELSFAWYPLNVAAGLAALASLGLLTVFAFDIRPRFLVLSAIPAMCMWMVLFVLAVMNVADTGPVMAHLSGNLYCGQADYPGFDDEETFTNLYRRYLFIDHRIYVEDESAANPKPPAAPPAGLPNAPAQCKALLKAARQSVRR